jgi:hypothetical protein
MLLLISSALADPYSAVTLSLGSGAAGDAYGSALATGDLDGDGLDDLAVGVPGDDTAGADAGAVAVHMGSTSRTWPAASRIVGESGGDAFGAVLAVGDLDGDGLAELVVGAPEANDGSAGLTGAFQVYLSGTNLVTTVRGDDGGDLLGFSLAIVGDVDGDGLQDLLVGAPGATRDASLEGLVQLWPGATGGIGTTTLTTWTGGEADASLGGALGGTDVDGDGHVDVLLAAPGAGGGAGKVSLYPGSPGGTESAATWIVSGTGADRYGLALGPIGDLDGDGAVDVGVGSSSATLDIYAGGGSLARSADHTLALNLCAYVTYVTFGSIGDPAGDGDDEAWAAADCDNTTAPEWDSTVQQAALWVGAPSPARAPAWHAAVGYVATTGNTAGIVSPTVPGRARSMGVR